MPLINARISSESFKLIQGISDNTGATTSSVVAALLDYFTVLNPGVAEDFIAKHVSFYTIGYKINKRGRKLQKEIHEKGARNESKNI